MKDPKEVTDYKRISLCNVSMRIASKVLANRIKDIQPSIIGEQQSAFIRDRLISDNVTLAYELVHSLKQKKNGSKGVLALKVDMSKAFDRVSWKFLRMLMHKMGAEVRWVDRVMQCGVSFL